MNVLEESHPLWNSTRESLSGPFQLLELRSLLSLVHDTFFHLPSQQCNIFNLFLLLSPHHLLLFCGLLSLFPYYKYTCDYIIGLTWVSPGSLPISRTLIASAKSLLPLSYQVTYSQGLEVGNMGVVGIAMSSVLYYFVLGSGFFK